METLRHRISTDTRYVMAGFPVSVIAFTLVVAGVSAGLGSLVVFVGLLILAATALVARAFADLERAMLPDVVGQPLARPEYPQAPAGAGWLRRAVNPLASGQVWADLLHAIVIFPFAVASFVVTVVWWAGAIAGLTFPLYGWILAKIPGMIEGGLPALLGLAHTEAMFVTFNTVLGVGFALTLVPVVRVAALLKAGISQAMLTRAVYPVRSGMIHAV